MYHRQRNPFDATVPGFPSSLTFSGWCWMGDHAQISIQIGNASTVTLYGTNKDGWKNSLNTVTDASVITTIAGAGVYKVEPGFEWAQFQRSQSTNTIFYVGQSRH